MDKEKAKEYLFDDQKTDKIYISKDLQKLMDMNDGELFFIYAVLETESGDTLMNMEWSYSGEPIKKVKPVDGNGKMYVTQKPVALIQKFVLLSSAVGGVVLDAFMGSGTTAVACIKEKRHFVGFELNKEYFDIAQRRIANELRQPTLF